MRSALVITLLAVASLTGCTPPAAPPIPLGTGTPEPAPAALGPCADGTITPTIGEADGTAGHLNYQISYTNSGPECTLQGYGQVAVVSAGTQLGEIAGQMTGLPTDTITIATGASAYAWLEAVNIDPGGGPLGPDCVVGFGDGYLVWVPGALDPVTVPADHVPACTSGPAWMQLSPISAS